MTLHRLFIAGVLKGLEGTLSEIVARVEDQELNTRLDALRGEVEALRTWIEDPWRASRRRNLWLFRGVAGLVRGLHP
jgi:hypothetical protein